MQNSTNFEISIPIYTYAKKVLVHHYGEHLQDERLKKYFFTALGVLYSRMDKLQMRPPVSKSLNIPIELVLIKTKLPKNLKHTLSLYSESHLSESIAYYFNGVAKELLLASCNTVYKLDLAKNKLKSCELIFMQLGIDENELSVTEFAQHIK